MNIGFPLGCVEGLHPVHGLLAVGGELLDLFIDLEGQIGAPVTALAYPNGRYNAYTEAIARSLGFRVTVSTTIGTNYIRKYDRNSLYRLNRFNMNESVSADTLIQWLNRR